jgi:hypothetical protein
MLLASSRRCVIALGWDCTVAQPGCRMHSLPIPLGLPESRIRSKFHIRVFFGLKKLPSCA